MNFSACTTRIAFSLAATLISLSAAAQVSVSNPWVRATVPAQKVTGAFMDLTATQDARLVAVKSPGAGTVEVHEMSTDGGVMKMRAMPDGLELPAGRSVELKPGGYHIMLMDLKAQVKEGDRVPMTLIIEYKDGKRQILDVTAPVKALSTSAAPKGHSNHVAH